MSDLISSLTTSTFDEYVTTADRPVVVDFWAEWCGPCKMIAPVLEEIATEQQDRLRVAKVNVDENPELARRYDVLSIPTLLVLKEGKPLARIVGARGKAQLLQELAASL
jgi:thioredoxin 1